MARLFFGKKLKELRAERGVTQKTLAVALNVVPNTVTMYETDRITPSPDVLLKIADYFDITLDELFGREFRN